VMHSRSVGGDDGLGVSAFAGGLVGCVKLRHVDNDVLENSPTQLDLGSGRVSCDGSSRDESFEVRILSCPYIPGRPRRSLCRPFGGRSAAVRS
jgi:hypothetical protein